MPALSLPTSATAQKSAVSAAKPAVGQEHETPARSVPTSVTAQKSDAAHAANFPTASANGRLTIFTIGHSTHPIDEFIALLREHGIEQLVDVRTVPKSRHVPQFNSEALAGALGKRGIAYVHLKALGGLRHAKKDSVNTGWRNASFRGYADHMSTQEFAQGIDQLIELARKKHTVIMCAEAVPWRCHRSLIGDALLVRGIAAEDIMSTTSIRQHKLTEFAKIDGQQITYPADKNLELSSG
ncbi:MAG: DUF488 domain-containing protein [Acidobacteria bacterium]|nr:DUF488 domain-containing protein [Acidobacteriota bacterium]